MSNVLAVAPLNAPLPSVAVPLIAASYVVGAA
jgi:hypothetical protein